MAGSRLAFIARRSQPNKSPSQALWACPDGLVYPDGCGVL